MSEHSQNGLITEERFNQILTKLVREFPKSQLHFYNWTEPLIHPRIAAMCKAAADAGFHVHLSSNLNYLKDPELLLQSGCKTLRISLSGFTQSVYQIGHRGGRIDTVKANMHRLADAKKRTGSRTRIHVYYHKYRHNLHEPPMMEAFAKDLGFDFISDWAYLMPLEKALAYVQGQIPDSDLDFASRYIVPDPRHLLNIMKPHADAACELIDQLVLDFQGDAYLCCAVYDRQANRIGNYLQLSWEHIQRARYAHCTCESCLAHAAHVSFTYFNKPELRIAVERLAEEQLADAPAGITSLSLPVLV